MEKRFWSRVIWIYLAVYITVSLLFLVRYPMMHSDESWLSGLSRAMMQRGLNTTEPFFDLFPAYPNAISVLFNLIQMAFIAVFGYNLFSVRLISLIFGAATLIVFHALMLHLTGSAKKSLAATAVLSLDVQFIAASHLARQDIIIAFGAVTVLYYIIRYSESWCARRDFALGIVLGLMAGLHPNSLMVAACAGSLYLYYICLGRIKLRNLLILVLVTACFAGIYVGASFLMDKDFLRHYLAYGSTLGVGGSITAKLSALPDYFLKLFYGVSGTYTIPPIRFQLILFGTAVVISAVYSVFKRDMLRFLLPVFAVLAAVVVIGRYSQPAVVVFFPLCWLLVFVLLDRLPTKTNDFAAVLLGAALLVQSAAAVRPYLNDDYGAYLTRIEADVPRDSKVLANLNAEYAFDCGMLLDYRNLQYLGGLSFEEYIKRNHIGYIIYPEEMDYIYEHRPVWNILYGNLYPYFEDMKAFLSSSCTLTDEFKSPYAMRITGLSSIKNWGVSVYKVKGVS